ncbi:MAG TPA: YqaA family protein [Geminicoccaceae bacterium]|nr:YqaA family protein [Geminicoccaceae bacterium]
MEHLPALPGLFLVAFLAATVLPAQSEFALAGLHLAGAHDKHVLVAVATAGNVLGSTVNWVLGRYLVHFQNRRWFPIKGRALGRATRFYQRWGVWTLLLAWAPIIGDPLTRMAGIFRTSLWVFVPW